MRILFMLTLIFAQVLAARNALAFTCQRKLGYSGTRETIALTKAASDYVLTGTLRRFLATRWDDPIYNLSGKNGPLLPAAATNQGFEIKPTRMHCSLDAGNLGDCYFSDNQMVVTGTSDKKDYTLTALDSTTSRISVVREFVERGKGVRTEGWGIEFTLFPAQPSVTEIGETLSFSSCE